MASGPRTPELAALGATIRALRKAKGLSQEGLALEISVSRNHIGKVERAQQSPTFDRLVLIARGLEITLSELMGGYEERFERELQETESRAEQVAVAG
ncbi:MAG TPA: helix-turn-helix transcriptional regulator [Thermoleophilaceae bacterium]